MWKWCHFSKRAVPNQRTQWIRRDRLGESIWDPNVWDPKRFRPKRFRPKRLRSKRFKPKAFSKCFKPKRFTSKTFQWNSMNCEPGRISFGSPINAVWIQRVLAVQTVAFQSRFNLKRSLSKRPPNRMTLAANAFKCSGFERHYLFQVKAFVFSILLYLKLSTGSLRLRDGLSCWESIQKAS